MCGTQNSGFYDFADDGEKTIYKNEMLSAKALDQDLSNDQIVKHALVTDGFDVVPEVKDPVYIEDEKQLAVFYQLI